MAAVRRPTADAQRGASGYIKRGSLRSKRILAAIFLTSLCAIVFTNSNAQAQNCFIYIDRSFVCVKQQGKAQCTSIDTKRNSEIEGFRCLVRNEIDTKKCKGVYIAYNTFLRFLPVSISYHLIFSPGESSKDFYSEEKILRSCSPF